MDTNTTAGKGKVYLVEDDAFFRMLIGKKLTGAGFELHEAATGKAALELFASGAPETLILDIMLPDMDGFEILKAFRNNAACKQVSVIMLSNMGSKEDIDRAKTLGADHFLIKATVSLDEVVKDVEKAIAVTRDKNKFLKV